MNLQGMNLNNVPLLPGVAPVNTSSEPLARMGDKLLEALMTRVTEEATGGQKGQGFDLRQTLEMFKLFRELMGTGDEKPRTAKDSGMSDVMMVFAKMMEQSSAQTMMLMKEIMSKKEGEPAKETSKADDLMMTIAMNTIQGAFNQPDPKDKLREYMELRELMQSAFPNPAQQSLADKLRMAELDLRIEEIKANTAVKIEEAKSSNENLGTALNAVGEFFRSRRDAPRALDAPAPLGRTAAKAVVPSAGGEPPHTMNIRRFQCGHCGLDTLVTATMPLKYCPECGADEFAAAENADPAGPEEDYDGSAQDN